MPQDLLGWTILLAALGCAAVGGIFLAFSNFVMRALARLPAAQGITAMQSINVAVLNPLFLCLFTGTAILCALLAGYGLWHWDRPGSAWLITGGVSYVLGNLAVTRICNIPRNDALARVAPAAPEAEGAWRDYLRGWNPWNNVRTVTALAAAAALLIAR